MKRRIGLWVNTLSTFYGFLSDVARQIDAECATATIGHAGERRQKHLKDELFDSLRSFDGAILSEARAINTPPVGINLGDSVKDALTTSLMLSVEKFCF